MFSKFRRQPSWLGDAVFYQVYPQSFLDTNGDGIGDLNGITAKLDYIQSLGCTGLWLNPFFESPFRDAGYDVTDFRKIAPRYGTLADFRRLTREAHKRGMRVCLDLVPGHTSNEHPWFRDSSKAKPGKYKDWYVWTDNIWGKVPPGIATVAGMAEREGQFIANFFSFQPALNYGFAQRDRRFPWQQSVAAPGPRAVRQEFQDIMRYWLSQGADGFRVDMAYSLVKQDPGLKETKRLWREIRAMMDREYPEAALISEWSVPHLALPAGFHADFLIHIHGDAYTSLFRHEKRRDSFHNRQSYGRSYFDRDGAGNLREFLAVYLKELRGTQHLGYISIPSGNHDIVRLADGRTDDELKVVFAFLFTLPGLPVIYYGDEIGMRQRHDLPSKEGGYLRTGARTPMQWSRGRNAGFSKAAPGKLYLPIDPSRRRPTVEAQDVDEKSLLNHVRRLAALRKELADALGADAAFTPLRMLGTGYPFVYARGKGDQRVIIAVNPSGKSVRTTVSARGDRTETLLTQRAQLRPVGRHTVEIELGAVSFGIWKA